MTSAELLAALLLLPVFLACLWRARLLAPAILPPLLFSVAQWLEAPGLESASHPLRWIVPVACAGLAGMALWKAKRDTLEANKEYWSLYANFLRLRKEGAFIGSVEEARRNAFVLAYADTPHRAALASLLVLGSCAPDLLALHPWFWSFAEWALVPIMIAVEATILVALIAPERWVVKWMIG